MDLDPDVDLDPDFYLMRMRMRNQDTKMMRFHVDLDPDADPDPQHSHPLPVINESRQLTIDLPNVCSETGNVTRQEAVSMIPPIVLDVKPNHKVTKNGKPSNKFLPCFWMIPVVVKIVITDRSARVGIGPFTYEGDS